MKELIIVGGGVAGMTASIYASRYHIKHYLFGEVPGGQGMLAGTVENYPGYLAIPGPELMQKLMEQVKKSGGEVKQEKVGGLAKIDGGFEVKTEKAVFQAKTLILAMGASFRSLNIPGEDKFMGKGVSYCTTCDIPLFRDKTVAIIGGGDSAVTSALHAAEFAQKVFIIHRRKEYRAEPAWVEKMRQTGKIEEVLANEVKEIKGTEKVVSLVLKNPYQNKQELAVDGVFIEIGQVPTSSLVKPLGVALDEGGYIKVSPAMATKVPGIFAAGDAAAIQGGLLFRQFITAAADGARAAASVYQCLHQGAIPAPSWGQKS
ncbi:MAG: FAD-dependent oxidoreductase [Candidatus Marinimicrobia bacterium]|nr:FAD-dependent oxidoreductase [Candidatus Neomarinimicrobiota bacterium]